jgi:hypothetical protein
MSKAICLTKGGLSGYELAKERSQAPTLKLRRQRAEVIVPSRNVCVKSQRFHK